MAYCLYLRKSRSDLDAEAHGETETLARHERLLLELAKKRNLNITQIYREVVSGETIAARPVMQHLLSEVGQGLWDGVLVVEVERLARGDTVDQGIMAQTFKYSNTKIITPLKDYDPNNEFDEEYFEFGLFMSRREYKTINRRLQRGRIASVKEGKYVASVPPYGYERVRLTGDKGWTLAPVEDEAAVVSLIFEWYTKGVPQPDGSLKRIGTSLIAKRLNSMNIPPKKGKSWACVSVRDMLSNPIYMGKIRWNWRRTVNKMIDGKLSTSRPRSNDYILFNGLHPAIVSEDVYNAAQEIMTSHKNVSSPGMATVKNPLAGLVICGKCGKRMVRRPYMNNSHADTLICVTLDCNNVSSQLDLVETRILQALDIWLKQYKMKWDLSSDYNDIPMLSKVKRKALEASKQKLSTLYGQLEKSHDLLEQGVYDTDTFLDRSRILTEKINTTKKSIETLSEELNVEIVREASYVDIIPKVEKLLDVYSTLSTPKAKNDMLKEILEKVVYTKEHGTRWHGSADDFEIEIYPKLPKYIKE